MACIIAIAANKGGVGKTSITTNVGGELAAAGYRVLIVGLDHQDNLGEDLGYDRTDASDDGAALAATLTGGAPLTAHIVAARPNLDVAPGGPALITAARQMAAYGYDPLALAENLPNGYDFILIDCPPGDLQLQHIALCAARWVVVPTQADSSSRKGIRLLASQYQEARESNPDIELLGIVLFDVPTAATRMSQEIRQFLSTELGGAAEVFATAISSSKPAATAARDRGVLMRELAHLDEPVWRQLREGIPVRTAARIAQDYVALTEQILRAIATRSTTTERKGRK